MKYNRLDKFQENKLQARLKATKDKMVEFKEVRQKRSVNQNAYLHVCITLYAIEFGYTIEEAKTHLKRNCEFMKYEKKGEIFVKRTRYMDSKELTNFIDWLRTYASQNGCYIPTSEEYLTNRVSIDNQIETNKQYL